MSINMKEAMNTEQKYITQNDRLKCTKGEVSPSLPSQVAPRTATAGSAASFRLSCLVRYPF